MQNLKVVAVASSEQVRTALFKQLQSLGFVEFDGVLLELADAAKKCFQLKPDVIILDLSGREDDAGLFMQTIGMDPDSPCTLFALHNKLDHQTIVTAVKNGAKEFIQYPDEADKLEIALRRYVAMINRAKAPVQGPAKKPTGKLISVFSPKGGSGCTTVAVNLAYHLQVDTGHSVALFDLDQVFSNTAVMLNLSPNYSVGDLADSDPGELDAAVLKRIGVEHESGLKVFVASKSVLDDHEMISPELLEHMVSYLVDSFDFVVVDLPTHVLDPYHQYMIERSDDIILVSCLDIPGLSRTRQYLELARQFLDMSKVKLVLNRFNQKAAYGMSNESVEEQFGYPVYSRLPNDWEVNVEANSLGCAIAKVKEASELTKAFHQLAGQVSGQIAELGQTATTDKGGLIGKLFGIGGKKKGEEGHVVRKTELG